MNKTVKEAAASLADRVKTVGFICPMDCELAAVTRLFSDLRTEAYGGALFYTGSLYGRRAVAVKCGVGKVFAAAVTQSMILGFSPDLIINTGVGGNLSDTLSIGDIALSTAVVQHDMDTSPLGDPVGLISGINKVFLESDPDALSVMRAALDGIGIQNASGVIASGDQFIDSSEKKEEIVRTFGAISCEMEGAAVGQVCYMNGVPFLVIRAISDDANGESPADFPAYCVQVSENSSRAISAFMRALAP